MCDKKFAQSCSLNRHFKKSHPNEKSNFKSNLESESTMSLNSKIHTMLMNLAPIPNQDMQAAGKKIYLDKFYKCDQSVSWVDVYYTEKLNKPSVV